VTSFVHDSPELAESYDKLSEWQFAGGKRLVERLGLKAGDRVLDVGCGTGRLTRWLSGIVGPEGVFGIDPLADRIALARHRAPAISYEVGRAEDLSGFDSESFDAVCMTAVFHWVQDKAKALLEAKRVLRRGGRFGMTALPKELRLASGAALVLEPLFERKPYDDLVNPAERALEWRGNTLTELVTMLLQAGFDPLELHLLRRTHAHESGQEVVEFLESSSFGNFLRLVPEDRRSSFRADVAAAFEATRRPDGIPMHDYGTIIVAERA
jgi:ubiquinone/menaquinone biosynthesis C-methylase UbiE